MAWRGFVASSRFSFTWFRDFPKERLAVSVVGGNPSKNHLLRRANHGILYYA